MTAVGEETPLFVNGKSEPVKNRWRLIVCLSVAFFLDGSSTAALAASFRALEMDPTLGLSPLRQGLVLMLQSLTGSIFAPPWGMLADRYDRIYVLAGAASIWAVGTLMTPFSGTFGLWNLAFSRLLFGVGTAGMTPVVQSVVGDTFADCERGRAFSVLIASHGFGVLLATAIVTAISRHEVPGQPGVQGWHCAFALLGVCALAFALALLWARESLAIPRHGQRVDNPWQDFVETLKTPSFRVVLLQGAFVSTALEAHAYLVQWVQYIGYPDWQAGLMVATLVLGAMLGCFVGGYLADKYAETSPDHGRIYVGQFGGTMMIIFWVGIVCLPRTTAYGVALTTLFFLFGFVKNWEYVGAIRPILVEIAPNRRRAIVIAYAACIDGVVAACIGGPMVGYLAEGVFGYRRSSESISQMPVHIRLTNLTALTWALSSVTILCIVCNLLSFTLLHFTYGRDRAHAKLHDE